MARCTQDGLNSNEQLFTYGISEQKQLKVLDGGDGTVPNQLHQGCRKWIPL